MKIQNTKLLILIAGLAILASCTSNKNVTSAKGKQRLTEKDSIEFKFLFSEAGKLKMQANYEDAITYYSKCLEIIPNSAASHYEIGRILIKSGDYHSALAQVKKANELNPENFWYKKLLADLYLETQQIEKAIEVYQQIVAELPNELDYQYNLASIYTMAGDPKKALQMYNQLESKVGVNEYISLSKNKLFFQMKKRELVYEELNKLIKTFPDEPRFYGMLAELYANDNRNDEALKVYQRILELEPDNGLINLSLSTFYNSMDEKEKAYTSLKKAFEDPTLEPSLKVNAFISTFSFADSDDKEKQRAFDLLKILIKKHPENSSSRIIYADYLIKYNKLTEAREQLYLILETDKTNFQIWEQLLYLDIDMQDFNALLKDSEDAIEYFPNQASLYLYNGIAANRLGKLDDAIDILSYGKSLVINNQTLESQFLQNLGEVYFKNKMHTESDAAFDKVLQIEPDNVLILNNFAYYLSLRTEKLEKAEQMSRKVIEKEPTNGTYLDTYGWILYKMQRYDEAKKILEKALENGGAGSAVIIEHYGDILYKLDDKENAKKQWQKASETGEGSEFLNEKIEKGILVE